MQKLPTTECVLLLESEVQEAVWSSLKRYRSRGLLVYQNVELYSGPGGGGNMFAMGWGPNNTIQTEPTDDRCPIDPPGMGFGYKYRLVAYSDDLQEGELCEKS